MRYDPAFVPRDTIETPRDPVEREFFVLQNDRGGRLRAGVPYSGSFRWRLTAKGTVLAVLTGAAFGLAPALRFARLDLHDSLRQGTRQAGGRAGLRRVMVVAEMALAVVLLVGTGLLVQSFRELRRVDPGFRAENVLTLRLALPPATYGEPERWDGFFDRLLERVSALPGVEHAGINIGAMGDQTLRAVTHLDVEAAQITEAADALVALVE